MQPQFDIRHSSKSYLHSPEKFIVSREASVYLRVLGEEGRYAIITATADEDGIGLASIADQAGLMAAALETAEILGTKSAVLKDFHQRQYVHICNFEYLSDAFRVAELFFSRYDAASASASASASSSAPAPEGSAGQEMRQLYQQMAADESGEEIYLSDGMWLGSDGTLSDRGR